jgi:hypothetical protein
MPGWPRSILGLELDIKYLVYDSQTLGQQGSNIWWVSKWMQSSHIYHVANLTRSL